jgi:diacylglycerol kinase
VSTAVVQVSQVIAVESTATAVESVVDVSVFSAPVVQEAKKIVAAKSMNVIFFIIVFCLFVFCKLFV